MPDSRYPSNVPIPPGCAVPVVEPLPATPEEQFADLLEEPAPSLYSRLRAMLQRRGYSGASIDRKLEKCKRGREKHGEDLYLLDYLGEMTQEGDDLAVYLALWWMHGGPQTPTVVELMATVRKLEVLMDRLKVECGYPTPTEFMPDPTGVSLMAVAEEVPE